MSQRDTPVRLCTGRLAILISGSGTLPPGDRQGSADRSLWRAKLSGMATERSYEGLSLHEAVRRVARHHVRPDVRHINDEELHILLDAADWLESNGCEELIGEPQLFSRND